MRATPDVLASGYDFLRTTTPFRGWKLPPSDEIEFHVVLDPTIFADFGVNDDGQPVIRVSASKNGHTTTLLMSIGHEMLHLHQYIAGLDRGSDHNRDFKAKAKRICQAHGWDVSMF